MVISH